MKKGTPDPPFEILRTFGQLAAMAMQRKQASEALQESEDKYRQLIETMSEGVVVVANDDAIQFVNPAACNIYGYNEKDLLGKTGYKLLVHEDDWDMIKYKNSLRQNGITDSYLVRGKKISGEIIWIRISGSPITDKAGRVVGSVGILSDVTQIKQNEEALLLQYAYLDELIEGAAEGIVVLDKDEYILRVNQEFTRIFGFTQEEALGKSINDLIVPDDLQDEGRNATNTVSEGNRVYFETVRKHKSGALIDVSVLGNPIRLEGKHIGVYGIYRDITDRKKLEEQLRQSQRLDSIGQLAGGVAHDFNNILQALLGIVDLMQMGKMDKESVDKMLNEVGSYVNRGINLSKKLLMFSRSEKPDFQIGDLNRIIMETDGLLKHLIPANIKIEYELSKDKLLIEADSHQIEQVLINLVVNASDAMPDGGQIFISTSGSKKKCIMKVSDTGTGMNKSTIDKIFEPFYTTKEKGKGTGLGLSVVHGILNQHNAKITVKSAIGKGSEFCVEFARQAHEEEFEELKEKTAGKIFRGSGEKILVIEDTEDVRISLKEMLASIGYDVETAENAEEGEKPILSFPCP